MGNVQVLQDGEIEDLYVFDGQVVGNRREATYGYFGVVRKATRKHDGLEVSVKVVHKANRGVVWRGVRTLAPRTRTHTHTHTHTHHATQGGAL